MGFFDPVVSIRKVSWKRLQMLVSEVEYMNSGEELTGLDLEHETEKFVQSLVDEYIRQYFEESTKAATQLINKRQESVPMRHWLR